MATRLAKVAAGSGATGALSSLLLAASHVSFARLGVVLGIVSTVVILLIMWLTSSDERARRANLLLRGQPLASPPAQRLRGDAKNARSTTSNGASIR